VTEDGLAIAVRLTPRGGRDAIDRIDALADGRQVVAARVRSAPTDGSANEALRGLIAKALHVPASRVAIASGAASRIKMVTVEGDGARMAAALDRIVGQRES
jgi:uncharacterized protein